MGADVTGVFRLSKRTDSVLVASWIGVSPEIRAEESKKIQSRITSPRV